MKHEYVKGSLTDPNSPTVTFDTQYDSKEEWAKYECVDQDEVSEESWLEWETANAD